MEKAKPIHTIRVGNIQASIWRNDTKHGVLYNTTFSRVYQDDGGNVQGSHSFAPRDLSKLLACIFDVREFLAAPNATPKQPEDDPGANEQ